jgi:hypothetical protein
MNALRGGGGAVKLCLDHIAHLRMDVQPLRTELFHAPDTSQDAFTPPKILRVVGRSTASTAESNQAKRVTGRNERIVKGV